MYEDGDSGHLSETFTIYNIINHSNYITLFKIAHFYSKPAGK